MQIDVSVLRPLVPVPVSWFSMVWVLLPEQRIPGSGLGSSLVWMLLHVLVPVIRVKGVLLPVPLSRFQVQHGVGSVSTGPFRVPGTRLGSSMKVCWSSLVSV